jgi:hypothetical protein
METLLPNSNLPEAISPGIADHLIGRHVIIRASGAGVHAGVLAAHNGGQVVRLTSSRRLWYWHAACGHSLTGVALHGLNAGKSKIAGTVADQVILDACEIIATTPEAQASIESAVAYEP